MSTSPEGRKRPRASDSDERDVKRLRNDNAPGAETGEKSNHQTGPPSQEWLTEKMSGMEKLYKEVLIQSALIFQHQSFSKRLGLNQQNVPSSMMHRLEATWRTYEGLRRQIEWCMVQTGTKLPASPSANTGSGKPSSTLAAIMRLASNVTPPTSTQLPTPVNIHVAGKYIPLDSPASPDSEKEGTSITTNTTPVEQKPGLDALATSQIPSDQQTGADVMVKLENQKSVTNNSGDQSQQTQTSTVQTGLVEPPPPVSIPLQVQVAMDADANVNVNGNGAIDYSTLGLDELEALVNGNAFGNLAPDMGMSMDMNTDISSNNNNPSNLIANPGINLNGEQNPPNSGGNGNSLFASLGLDTGTQQTQAAQSTISLDQQSQSQQPQAQQQQDQPIDFDFSQALSNGSAGLEGDMDFSALAGLFSNEQPPTSIPEHLNLASGSQMDQGTESNKVEGLDSIFPDGIQNSISNDDSNLNNDNSGSNNNSQSGAVVDDAQNINSVEAPNQVQPQNQKQDQDLSSSLLSFDQPPQTVQQALQVSQPPAVTSTAASAPSAVQSTAENAVQPSGDTGTQAVSQVDQVQQPQQPQPQEQQEQQADFSVNVDNSQSQSQSQQQPFDFGFQPDLSLPTQIQNQNQAQNSGQTQILDIEQMAQQQQPEQDQDQDQDQDQGNEFGQIDMSDFNFTDAGIEGMGMGGDEFERLMAEFE
ncbi:uncharacterized protein I303_108002 [Kwoniella dejecticola CBS 10117]|uniref:Uncharacterized protein n=1 Tax=Kwoniella dejecticola CBS 10117 TaxID=1296121 RepID=A0A1A5ZW99_9TREE|nr:uncharacterized protein I303_07993 [Kwoniella dejecticola CBS 10117]OBR82079.1 hypothetical protein I303_07993 [Kwoniella dejecticola CBS 10117]